MISLHGDPQISRFHARIEPSGANPPVAGIVEYTVTDLESGNGTMLNDRRIAPQAPIVLRDGDKCFYQRARARRRLANVVIVNHALLFALISAGGAKANGATQDTRGVLFPDDFIVLDEAHTVPEVATEGS